VLDETIYMERILGEI